MILDCASFFPALRIMPFAVRATILLLLLFLQRRLKYSSYNTIKRRIGEGGRERILYHIKDESRLYFPVVVFLIHNCVFF